MDGRTAVKFLIKTAFWLTLVVFLVPVDDELALTRSVAVDSAPVGAIEAVGAAQAALDDVGGFCGRNPGVCDVGGRLAETFALKARSLALMAYRYFDAQVGGDGALPPATPDDTGQRSAGGTLTPSDLEPAWAGPAADSAI